MIEWLEYVNGKIVGEVGGIRVGFIFFDKGVFKFEYDANFYFDFEIMSEIEIKLEDLNKEV